MLETQTQIELINVYRTLLVNATSILLCQYAVLTMTDVWTLCLNVDFKPQIPLHNYFTKVVEHTTQLITNCSLSTCYPDLCGTITTLQSS